MSKTVIVFSTRFINPLVKNGLFSDAIPEPFTSEVLASYFWNDIKDFNNTDSDKQKEEYFKRILNERHFSGKEFKRLSSDIKQHTKWNSHFLKFQNEQTVNGIKNLMSRLSPNIVFDADNYDWLRELFTELGRLPKDEQDSWNWIIEAATTWNKYYKNISDKIKLKNGKWISENLNSKSESNQVPPRNLDNGGSKKPGPWFAYRFSYYKLKSSNKQVAVYAVWPLKLASKKDNDSGKYEWVEALTNQFLQLNLDADDLYLVLHDEDIEESILKILDDDTAQVTIDNKSVTAKRHTALFQHVDSIGTYLENPPNDINPEDILFFVKNKMDDEGKRKYLCNAFDYIVDNDADKLLKSAEELMRFHSSNFSPIRDIASTIKTNSNMNEEELDKKKIELIDLLNRELKIVMTKSNPKN